MAIGSSRGRFQYRLPARLHRWLNDDGERHPIENTLAFLALGLGLLSLLSLLFDWYDAAAALGLVGALVAAYDEFISKTIPERRLILTGFALCVVGLAIAMSKGAIF